MKFNGQHSEKALTLFEVLLIVAILAILVAFLLPAMVRPHRHTRAPRIQCINNLKQVGLGFRSWAIDYNSNYPMSVLTNDGGTLEYTETSQVFRHFQALSNEINTPKILFCPEDVRNVVRDFDALRNTNISYFVGLDANEIRPAMFLAGDRNLTNGTLFPNGLLELKSNSIVGWTKKIHNEQGNVGLADSSVMSLSSHKLREALNYTEVATNRLALPLD